MVEHENYSDEQLQVFWNEFNTPIDEDECLEEPFYFFPAGTDRINVWHWFDSKHSVGVYKLMFPSSQD